MSIRVKFFASMKDLIGEDQELEAKNVTSVKDAWEFCAQGKPTPANMLIAVNMDYVDINHAVKDGDEVAFFPPVTGG